MKILSKTKNLIILGITAVITFILAFFCISTTYANASTYEVNSVPGASVLNDGSLSLKFTFNYNICKTNHSHSKFTYNFTVISLNVGQDYSGFGPNLTELACPSASIPNLVANDMAGLNDWKIVDSYAYTKYNNWYTSKKYHGNSATTVSKVEKEQLSNVIDTNESKFENNEISVVIKPKSSTIVYAVLVSVKEEYQYSQENFIGYDEGVKTCYNITTFSDGRSHAYVLKRYYEDRAGTMDLGQKEKIEEILYKLENGEEKEITVEYLVQIADSSFATKKTEKIKTFVYPNNELDIEQLESSLNIYSLDVFGTITDNYVYDEENDKYIIKYAKDVRLASKTVDGNTVNQFLDINKSFNDFYGELKDDGVINADLYEWFLAKVKSTNSSLKSLKYTDKNIYGYWGYAVVPDTYSLNGLVSDLFDAGTQYKGKLVQYSYNELLSLQGYNALLTKYQYPWFQRTWNNVAGIVGGYNAQHVLIVCEPELKETVVSKNGSTDADNENGLIRNKTEDAIENIGDLIGGAVGKYISQTKSMIYSILLLAVGVFIIYIIIKEKGNKRK